MLDYRTAISATRDTIHRRATLFRYQAIGVVGLIGLILLYSLVAAEWRALLSLLLLVPLCGAFFIADDWTVALWRIRLLGGWTAREIDFEAFRPAMRAIPRLPSRTLEGMLETLPTAGELTFEQSLLASTRHAIAAACVASHRRQSDALLLRVLASAIVAVVALSAVWTRGWQPLIGIVAIAIVPVAGAWLRRQRRAAYKAKLAACRLHPDFNQARYDDVSAQFR